MRDVSIWTVLFMITTLVFATFYMADTIAEDAWKSNHNHLDNYTQYTCATCGGTFYPSAMNVTMNNEARLLYCPNCGALMDWQNLAEQSPAGAIYP